MTWGAGRRQLHPGDAGGIQPRGALHRAAAVSVEGGGGGEVWAMFPYPSVEVIWPGAGFLGGPQGPCCSSAAAAPVQCNVQQGSEGEQLDLKRTLGTNPLHPPFCES